ncbi:CRISPR-associated helicase Cas3' [Nocardioides yefusunii]|uniref:CRISPR-associated helicase Cas3' n=1 Tax=Nocardioides yefusunii TaxID=2500546 RepID=UPI0013E2E068|nr:CRISPR-associated helicase Cas3' [Nocardioides yefusunii]
MLTGTEELNDLGDASRRPDPRLHGKDPGPRPGRDGSYPLLCHLLDTAVVMQHLWDTRVRPELRSAISRAADVDADQMRKLLAYAAAIHDLGKLNPYFQFQERRGSGFDFADELASGVRLPKTPGTLRSAMDSDPLHPLRRHEFLTHRMVTGSWAENTTSVRGAGWIGVVAGGHHGHWRAPETHLGWVGNGGDELLEGWEEPHTLVHQRVLTTLGVDADEVRPLSSSHGAVAFACTSGLLTLADWIASDDTQVRSGKELWSTGVDPYTSTDTAREWMRVRSETLHAHVRQSLGPLGHLTRDEMEAVTLGAFQPRPLQAEALARQGADDSGLWIAMYPTGDGKTEAALLRGAARPEEGLFFGLPTLATTDAMERRLQQVGAALDDPSRFPLIKSHQQVQLVASEDEPSFEGANDLECSNRPDLIWYSAAIRRLVAPNVVGTVDQALSGALAQRHITLRLLGLANHHVVLDEIHTFDHYQTELLVELLYWWGLTGTRVTLLSATLPSAHMRSMVRAYRAGVLAAPLRQDGGGDDLGGLVASFPSTVSVAGHAEDGHVDVTVRSPQGEVRRPQPTRFDVVEVMDREARRSAHVEWAKRTVSQHRTSPVAIVLNTVADCADVARQLASDESVLRSHDVLCLHSAMVAGHRTSIEAALVSRSGKGAHGCGFGPTARPVIVVGTQVIQASLDYDVDFMSSDLAPAPDLIQRLGRVWRFEGALPGEFRGGRLAESEPRTMQVVTVVDEAGQVSHRGAAPYLAAVLARTRRSLLDRIESEPVVDVFGFSQEWVDAAYDQDPHALFAIEESEAKAALDEVLAGSARVRAASFSRASLARPSGDSTRALLPAPRGKRSARWCDLVALTHRSDDEALMRTRFIEQEAFTVLLFDSSAEAHFRDGDGQAVRFPSLDIQQLLDMTPSQHHSYECFQMNVPLALKTAIEPALEKTLAGHEWKPRSARAAAARPLDLRHLVDIASYHPETGLTKDTA